MTPRSTHKDGPSGAYQKFGGTAGFSIDTRNPPAVLLHSRPINSKTLNGLKKFNRSIFKFLQGI